MCICALFKVYSGEWARKAIGNRLQQPCYLSRDDHVKEHIQGNIPLYIYMTIKLWKQLPAEVLETFPSISLTLKTALGK